MGKKTYKSRRIVGKLKVHYYLMSNEEIGQHLPDTFPFTMKNLEQMAKKHKSIYIKPNVGSQGIGIYKVEQTSNGYQFRSTKQTHQFKEISPLYFYLRSMTKKKLIIQQGIDLEEVNNRPYDVRVMVQRKPHAAWVCTGIFSKVGTPKKIVTNYYQGGKLATMDKVYQKMDFNEEEISGRIVEMKEKALQIARVLSTKQPGMYEMGIDLAYDKEKKLWLIEVNSRMPEFYPIKFLDRSMYDRMLSYAKSYGRVHG